MIFFLLTNLYINVSFSAKKQHCSNDFGMVATITIYHECYNLLKYICNPKDFMKMDMIYASLMPLNFITVNRKINPTETLFNTLTNTIFNLNKSV